MKKVILTILVAFATLAVNAQNYAELRSKYLRLAANKHYEAAVQEGVRVCGVLSKEGQLKKALAICWDLDAFVRQHERESGRSDYNLRYYVGKERLRLYMIRKKQDECRYQLNQVAATVPHLKSDSLAEDWLMTQAAYYHRFGQSEKSLACYKTLFQKRSEGKDLYGIEACYKDMIAYAKESKNSSLNYAMNRMYTAWQDSIKDEKAALEHQALQKKYDSSQKLLKEKDGKITKNIALIITLCVVCALLACALLFVGAMMLKNIRQTRKLKKSLTIANENNEQKSKFIKNISGQMAPALNAIEAAATPAERHTNVAALIKLMADIQTFAHLEETREEHYTLEDMNINTLCGKIMDNVKPDIPNGIEVTMAAPQMGFKTNAEVVEKISSYILCSMAQMDETEKIGLEFKKRSAHSGQMIYTNYGGMLTDEERSLLFKPFTEAKDITKDNGLGYPMCSLMAFKLNGTLHLDDDFKRGTRLVLDLHDN